MTNTIDEYLKSKSSLSKAKASLLIYARNKAVILFVGIMLMAFLMRIWGIDFGLPYRYHIDETFYVALSLKLPSNGFELPVRTHGPNLFFLLLLAEDVLYFLFKFLTGQVSSIAAFEQLYRSDPTNFVILARALSAIVGTLTLIPVYLLGKKLYRPIVGILAAILLGFSFQHIRESHYGTPDIFVGFLVTISLLSSVNILKKGRLQDYLLAGIFAGLATGTKFTNVLVLFPLMIAHIYNVWADHSQRNWFKDIVLSQKLWASLISLLVSFAIAYPNLLFRPGKFLEYVDFLIDVGKNGFLTQFIIEPAPAWIYYPFSLSWGLGWLLIGALIIAIIVALFRRKPDELLLLGFIFIYLVVLFRSPYYASRYLIPLLPTLYVFSANGIYWVADRLAKSLNARRTILMIVIAFFSLMQPISSALRHNYLLKQTDTRTLAKEWIEDNIPESATIAVDWRHYAPPLQTQNENSAETVPKYNLVIANGIGLPEQTVDEYYVDGVRFVVVSSFIDGLPLAKPADLESRKSFHDELDSQDLIYEIRPYSNTAPRFIFDQLFGPVISLWKIERPGPTLQVYRLSP